jgi:sugar/nucleoside kinase (ribokinase family)
VNYRPPLWKKEIAKAVIAHTIEEYANILEITDDEMNVLGWGERPKELVSHFSRIPQICAVKMGEQGCYVRQGDKEIRVKPFSMDIVDTVGAGDAFDTGLIVGVLEEMEFERLAQFANAVAALTCRDVGPLRAQPTREEVERLLELSPDN